MKSNHIFRILIATGLFLLIAIGTVSADSENTGTADDNTVVTDIFYPGADGGGINYNSIN